jgi:hypothetical protein
VLVMIEDRNKGFVTPTPEGGQRTALDEWSHSLLGACCSKCLRSTAAFAYCATRFCSWAIDEHLRDATSAFDLTDVVLSRRNRRTTIELLALTPRT